MCSEVGCVVGSVGQRTFVVVADDDGDIRDLVNIAVQRAGMTLVSSVADGTSAFDAIQTHRPDMAILDVSMPGKTGLELCQMVRADESLSGIKIMLLSAGATDASRQAGLDAGADEYYVKPFSPRELAVRLSELEAQPKATE